MPLTATSDAKAIVGRAIAVARALDAHLDVVFVRPDPEQTFAYTGLEPADFDLATKEISERVDEHGRASADRARRRFYAACKAAGVPRTRKPGGPGGVTASWHEAKGDPTLVMPEVARSADVTILSGALARFNRLFETVLEATLLRSGRPVLVLPGHFDTAAFDRALVAWDGGASCARAVSAWVSSGLATSPATVLHISEPHEGDAGLDAVGTHLSWHGIEAQPMVREKGPDPIGHMLLAAADEVRAGLVVMGGYGKSRYREAIFGGVTRHVIRDVQIPVLLMH